MIIVVDVYDCIHDESPNILLQPEHWITRFIGTKEEEVKDEEGKELGFNDITSGNSEAEELGDEWGDEGGEEWGLFFFWESLVVVESVVELISGVWVTVNVSMHIVASVFERIGAYSHLCPPLNINITNSVNSVNRVNRVNSVNSVWVLDSVL